MLPTALGGHRLLQGVAGFRHNHISLDGLAMLIVVADGPKSLGDLSPLPWMRSYISNSKLVALISMTFWNQLDCSANRDSSVFDVKLELRQEEKVDSSVDKWDSWETWDKGCYDYLEIRDGPSEASSILKELCGNKIPDPIKSSQNQMWLR